MNLGSRKANNLSLLLCTFLGALFAFVLFSGGPAIAATGINQEVNFQGRLLNNQGATVPDGFYNIEFKIYQDGDGQSAGNTTGSPTGTLKWTEDYLNQASHGVKVVNGYLSVPLGSINPFGTSVDWNQSTLWLSMNIGGTGASCTPFSSCSPDGEMLPMQRLTAAPYALNAGQLEGLSASNFIQLAQGAQTDSSTSSSLFINKTGASGNILQLQKNSADVLTLSNSGTLTLQNTADSTSELQIQNASGNAYITADSSNNKLVLGKASTIDGKVTFNSASNSGSITLIAANPGTGTYTLTLPAETGTICTTATICAGYAGAVVGGYVQLAPSGAQVDTTTNNSIFINKTGASGNLLELQNNSSSVVTVGNTGNVLLKNQTDSTTAFQIQNATTSTGLFTVDTTNGKVGVGGAPSSGGATFQVTGNISSSATVAATNYQVNGGTLQLTFANNNASNIQKSAIATSSINGFDVVVSSGSNGSNQQTASTTSNARDPRVYGVSGGTVTSGQSLPVILMGNTTVNVDTGAVSSGDQLVTSSSTGLATADNNATTGIIGIALSAKSAGSNGTVAVYVRPVNGQSTPIFRNATDSTTAFQIQNVAAKAVLTTDTSNGIVILGNSGASGVTGTLKFNYSGQSGSISLVPLNPSSTAYTLSLPSETGTICTNASTSACNTAGALTNVAYLNQDQTFTGRNTFSRNASGAGDYAVGVTGTPAATSSGSLLRLGNAIASGNGVANGGTYIGINLPGSGAGSAADFLNFQNNNTVELQLTSGGNLTVAGTYNTNTFTSSSLQFGAGGAATISSNGSNSLTVDTGASGGTLALGANAATTNIANSNAAHTVNIGTGGTSTAQAVTIGSATNTSSTLVLQGGNGSNAITLSTGNNGTTTAGSIVIGNTAGAFTQSISIGTNATSGSNNIVHIGDSSTAQNSITIGSTSNANSSVAINAGSTGGISLGANTTLGAGNNLTFASGAGNFNAGSSSGTFDTTTGNNNLNGNTVVANTKTLTVNGGASTFNGASAGSATAIKVNTNATTNIGVVIQAAASQTAPLFQLQDSTGAMLQNFDALGNQDLGTGYINTAYGGLGGYGNLILQSEQLGTTWTATNVTVTQNDGPSNPAPDSTTTADKVVSSPSGTHTLTQTYSSAGNNTYTFSMWVKTNSSTAPVQLRIDSNGTPGTGTAVNFTATTTWQRFSVTQTFSSGVSTVTPTLVITNNNSTVVGWGAQLQQSSSAGVYTRTTTAVVAANGGLVNNGNSIFQNSSNSTAAYQFQNASGVNVASVDTSNGQLVLGTASSLSGKIAFATAGGGTLTLTPTSTASSFTLTLPAETGTICTTATICSGYAAAVAGGYVQFAPASAQADTSTNDSIFINKTGASGNIVNLQNGGNSVVTVGNTGITTISRNGSGSGDYSLGITGTTAASSTSSLVRIGNAITGGNSAANGGTYIGINLPGSGAGSVADFLNFQNNNTVELQLTSGGNLTVAGTYNTNTFNSSTLQFGAGGAATINSNGSNNLTLDTGSSGGTLALGANAATTNIANGNAAHTINIGAGGTSTAQAITIGSAGTTTSTLLLQGGNGSGSITLQTGNNGSTAGSIVIGNTSGAYSQTLSIGTNATAGSTNVIHIGDAATSQSNITIGSSSNATNSVTLNAGTSGGINLISKTLVKPATNSTTAFQVQPAGSTTPILNVDTTNNRIGIGTATPNTALTIDSGTSGVSGLSFSQITSASPGSTAFTGILGLDSQGNVGLSQTTVSLTSPALAYWDGLNNPTGAGQSYPLATLSGSANYTGATNGVQLTPNVNTQSGSIDWSFSQVAFEETQFQMKAGGGTGADGTWFYSYADGTPTTEYGTGFTKGYIIYFSEYHDCIGITYGPYTDGNQCSPGGAGHPLAAVAYPNIDDNNWHDVDIQLLYNKIIVRLDGNIVLSYSDTYTRDISNLSFGFGARTGGSNNNHYIKNLLVTKLGTNVSLYGINNVSPLASGLYWDRVNQRLGVGTSSPTATLQVAGDALIQNGSSQDLLNVDGTGNQVILGDSGSLSGKLAFVTANSGSISIVPTNTSGTYTLTLPAETGTICTTASVCSGYAAASGNAVLFAPNSVQADSSTNNSVYINKTGASGSLVELQNNGNSVFNVGNNGATTLSRNGSGSNDYTLGVTGTTSASGTSSLVRIGNAIASGNSVANGGTYIGINSPGSGAGSAADFLNFQNNNSVKLQLTSGGNLTVAGTYNTNTFTSSTLQFGAGGAATINSNGSNNLTVDTGSSGGTLALGANAATTNIANSNAAHTVNIGAGGTSTAQAITIGSAGTTTSTLLLQGGNGSSAIVLQTGNNGTTTAGSITIGNTAGAFTQSISIGTNATSGANNIIHIGDSGTAQNSITIGSSSNANSSVAINAGSTGGISLGANTTLAANNNFTYAAGNGNFNASSSSGTFQTSSGANSLNGATTVTGTNTFTVNGGQTTLTGASACNASAVRINTGAASNVGTVIQGASAQTGSLLQLQDSTGAILQSYSAGGNVEQLGYLNTVYGGIGSYGNLLVQSEQLNTSWTATNITVTANDGASNPAPDGNNTADKLVASASGTHSLTQTYSTAGNNTYTFSMWVKTNSSSTGVQLRIDSNGTPATGTAASYTATTTWQRFSVTQTFSSGVTSVTPTLIITTNNATVVGWGAQLVQSSTPGVYVRTVGSTNAASSGFINNGTALFQNAVNSTTAYLIQNASGYNVMTVDTVNNILKIFDGTATQAYLSISYNDGTSTATIAASTGTTAIGNGTGSITLAAGTSAAVNITANATSLWRTTSGTLTLQSGSGSSDFLVLNPGGSSQIQLSGSTVLKLGQSAGDPGTCTAGAIVYNTTSKTLRGCQGNVLAWNDLVNTAIPTLQQTYTASTGGTTPEIKLGTTRTALDVQDADTSLNAALFNVRDSNASGLGTALFSVSSTGSGDIVMQDSAGNSLLEADGTNAVVQVGDSSAHSSNPILLTLDNYQPTTAGSEPNEADGAMYYDADENIFRCGVSGFWSSCAINSIQSSYVFEDEFLGGTANTTTNANITGVGALGWNVTATTSCTETYNNTATAAHDHPGFLRLTTGAANGNGCIMTQGGSSATGTGGLNTIIDVGDVYKASFMINSTTTTVRLGWSNATGNSASAGLYWQVSGSNLQYCRNSTCTTATTVSANTWIEVEIYVTSSSTATFVSNIGGTNTSDVASGSYTATGLGPFFTCYSTNSSASNCYLDFVQWSGYNTSGDGIRD
jgi:hypothetical protein